MSPCAEERTATCHTELTAEKREGNGVCVCVCVGGGGGGGGGMRGGGAALRTSSHEKTMLAIYTKT